MKRTLLFSLLAIALGTGAAVAGEGHDHAGGQAHESGANETPETEAFYGGDGEGEDARDHGDQDNHPADQQSHGETGQGPDDHGHGHDH